MEKREIDYSGQAPSEFDEPPTLDCPDNQEHPLYLDSFGEELLKRFRKAKFAEDIVPIFGTPLCPAEVMAWLDKHQAQHWTPAPRPKGVARWRAGACYANAYRLSVNREDLQYAEGIAASSQTPPFLHAWCVDQKGCVVDPTLANPEQFSFFGVRFSRADHVLALCQARGKDIINRLAKSDVVVKQYPSRYPYPSIFLTKPPNGQQGTDLD